MLNSFVVGSLLGLLLLCFPAFTVQAQEPARFDRVVALVSIVENAQKLSSGFCINHKENVFLVTARHAAAEMNLSTEVMLPAANAAVSLHFRLSEAAKIRGSNPWRSHATADVSACRLDVGQLSPEIGAQISKMAISQDELMMALPARTTAVEVTGFPLGLGIGERISPLVTLCHLASQELKVDGTWGKEPAAFASPAVGAGASGGPVMTHDDAPDKCQVIGMHLGVNADNTGAKLSRLLPIAHIIELLNLEPD